MTAVAVLALTALARSRRLGHVGVSAVQIAAVVLLFFTADRAMATLDGRGIQLGIASDLASVALNLLGYGTSVARGLLLIDHADGLVTVAPSPEKLALEPFLLFWLAWSTLRLVRNGWRMADGPIVGFAVTLIVGMARYITVLAVYIEHDQILVGASGQAALDLFGSPWIIATFLIIGGASLDRLMRNVSPPAEDSRRSRRPRELLVPGAIMLGLGGIAGLAGSFVPPGTVKAGRVLIDDRFCGIWEPTARRLDTQWYGDFSTYSFTSLAEWLGRWFSVDVNITRVYDDDLLSRYDVLIVKTLDRPIPAREAEAIDRFVHGGGGLLLVGDHTNLMGMGTHLNALSAKYGIRFQYDSVSDGATGGFVSCAGPQFGRHIGALHVDRLELMTSCSLRLSGLAEPILVADGCRREPHDYASSSFFGRSGPHPELEHGRTVLAAAARVGLGRIIAFTDSTVWSSFAVFQNDREKLAMDLIQLLNRRTSPYETPIRILGLVALGLAISAGMIFARSGLALQAIVFGLLGFWGGSAVTEALHRHIYAWPAPNAPINEVAFLWQGGGCAFPPVLGTPSSLPVDRCFDTLLVSIQRLGLVPRVAYNYEELLDRETRAVFVVAPVNHPPTKTCESLRSFVRGGGNLIVLDDSRYGELGSAKDFLATFGVSIAYHQDVDPRSAKRAHVHLGGGMTPFEVPADDTFAARMAYGRGQVVFMSDAVNFSREGLGHCFARPWKAARARYETIFAVLRDHLRITPKERCYYDVLK